MQQPLIDVRGLTKSFGGSVVVDDLSFHVAAGEIVGLLGPNGSGKTTTIRLLNGVLRPDQGSIRISGRDPIEDGEAVRQMSGVLTESADFYRHLSALDNLRFFSSLYGVTDAARPSKTLELFGLGAYADRKVGAFSTGMRKRLGLAKATLHDPPLLYLDEPTNGLDPEGTRMVLQHIRELNKTRGTTIILCSHLLQQLESVCHRYLFIDEGRLIEQGSLTELEEKYRTEVVVQVETDLVLHGNAYRGVRAEPGGPGHVVFRLGGREEIPGFLRMLVCDASVYRVQPIDSDLESLYFRIREEVRR